MELNHDSFKSTLFIWFQILLKHSFYPSNNGFDIALLKLERPVVYTDKIIPVCLPHGKVTKVGDKGIVTGWVNLRYLPKIEKNLLSLLQNFKGLTQEMGFASTTLNQVSVTVFSDVICYSNSITDICAGEITPIIHDSCQVLIFRFNFLFELG